MISPAKAQSFTLSAMSKNFPKTEKQTNRCGDCHKCCEHYSLEITNLQDQTLILSKVWGLASPDGCIMIDIQIPCQHLTSEGCKIYDDRPQTCRDFVCDILKEDT